MTRKEVEGKSWAVVRKEAKEHLARLRELTRQQGQPKQALTVEEVIENLRKVRAQLWEDVPASRS